MKAGFFDPYLDTIGGGERYCLTFAEALLSQGWKVDIFWPSDEKLKQKLVDKLSLDIKRVNFFPYSPRVENILNRKLFETNYDLLFYFSDGTIPLMFGKKNILHFQVPFQGKIINLKDRLKLRLIDNIVCNSLFTKKIIDKSFNVSSKVVYPPVDVNSFRPAGKENIILSVGRFSQLLQSKRQDVLVECFKTIIDTKMIDGWKLVLAGGSEIGAGEFLSKLRKFSEGYPVEILENPPFNKLVSLYGKAKIFWSASGYGVDEIANPEKVEHFGMSTVEGMAAGCVPIVLGKGGQKEIIESGKNGFLWQEKDELIRETVALVSSGDKIKKIAGKAILSSKVFSKERFYKEIFELLGK